jgi:hypothetical protein
MESIYMVDRYTRMLKPILELVNVLLISTTGEVQYTPKFEKWASIQEALVYILKDQNVEITLSSLYLLQLVTGFLFQLSNNPYYFVDLEKRGLDQLDNLMMGLITKYCVPRDWTSMVVPTNAEETKWSKQSVPGK